MTDKEIFYRSLQMWINYVETADVLTNRDDALRCCSGDKYMQRTVSRFPVQREEQITFVKRLKELKYKVLNNKI